jgi:integrase/recombinase XerD
MPDPCSSYLLSLSSDQSIRVAKSALNAFARSRGFNDYSSYPWGQLTADEISAFMVHERTRLKKTGTSSTLSKKAKGNQKEQRISPLTINTRLSIIKRVAHVARLQEVISEREYNRIKDIKRDKGTREPRGKVIDDNDFLQILTSLRKSKKKGQENPAALRDLAIFAVARYGGLRRTELASLDLEDCVWEQMSLRVRGKGNSYRIQPLLEAVIDLINDWIDVRGEHEGPLFTRIRRHGFITKERLTPQGIYHIITTVQENSEFKSIKPHDLRRTFCTQLLDEGVDLSMASKLMGHADMRTTQIYDMRDEKAKAETARNQRNVLGKLDD